MIGATNLVFEILRNAKVLESNHEFPCIVCWGGGSVNQTEYDYSKIVGQELGLRCLDICTGGGPGTMKGPMRGALYSYKRQNYTKGRFIGLTEPGIIAVEPPNGMVSDLIILPNIEKRLEAFVRIAHGIIIFPGGAGTFEEILYLLTILADPKNIEDPLPVVLTGPKSSTEIIDAYLAFLNEVLGESITNRLTVILDDPEAVASYMQQSQKIVRSHRILKNDAYAFNRTLHISKSLQQAFIPTHASMSALQLDRNTSQKVLASELRRLFSGIVSGNLKPKTKDLIRKNGPFEIHAYPNLAEAIDQLLERLISENRMTIDGQYERCYKLLPIR